VSAPQVSLSFLASQFGAHAAHTFAVELATIGLRVQDAGLLRMLGARPGMTQIEIAETFGVLPSRLVALIDGLEAKGLVRRQRDTADRRKVRVSLTPQGSEAAAKVATLTQSMERRLFQALSDDEQRLFDQLLRKLAADQGLQPGVHPAFPTILDERQT
jgi:DNA-binding MarR family transcriptional regulator